MKRNERTPNEQRIYKSKRANYLRVFDLSDGHHSTPDLSFQNIESLWTLGHVTVTRLHRTQLAD